MTRRRLTVRRRPRPSCGGKIGSTQAHCSSVKSVKYPIVPPWFSHSNAQTKHGIVIGHRFVHFEFHDPHWDATTTDQDGRFSFRSLYGELCRIPTSNSSHDLWHDS